MTATKNQNRIAELNATKDVLVGTDERTHTQSWDMRTSNPSDRVLASFSTEERERVIRHIKRAKD